MSGPPNLPPLGTQTAKPVPTADITFNASQGPLTTEHHFVNTVPDEEKRDFIVHVRASVLSKARSKLSQSKQGKFPLHELMLGICTLCLGFTGNAVTSKIPIDSTLGVISYIVCTVIAAGAGVAYFLLRGKESTDPNRLIKEVLEELPDPTKTSPIETKP